MRKSEFTNFGVPLLDGIQRHTVWLETRVEGELTWLILSWYRSLPEAEAAIEHYKSLGLDGKFEIESAMLKPPPRFR